MINTYSNKVKAHIAQTDFTWDVVALLHCTNKNITTEPQNF